MIWKAVFDAKSSTWLACGRVVYVDAATQDEAEWKARYMARAEHPGMSFPVFTVTQSTSSARAAFLAAKARHAAWLANVATGVPNHRELAAGKTRKGKP